MNDVMMEAPTPWQDGAQGLFRLPGFGGAAVFMRSTVVPAQGSGVELGLDIGLLSPDLFTRYLARTASLGFIDALSVFFFSAGNDQIPEQSVPTVNDHRLGLSVGINSSDGDQVEVNFTILEDIDAPVADYDVFNFVTSRAVLVQAGRDVRILNHVGVEPDSDLEIPEEWDQL